MLFIHNDVVEQVLTMEDAIACLERAFRQLVEGTATHRPRCDMYAPSSTVEDGYYRWGTMEGYNDGIFAIRMKSDVMAPGRERQLDRRKILCRAGYLLRPCVSAQRR